MIIYEANNCKLVPPFLNKNTTIMWLHIANLEQLIISSVLAAAEMLSSTTYIIAASVDLESILYTIAGDMGRDMILNIDHPIIASTNDTFPAWKHLSRG